MGITSSGPREESIFATAILSKWAWGGLSAPDVQQFAHCAKLSGVQDDEVDDLASCGGYGTHDSNIHADLMRKFFEPILAPQPIQVEIDYMDPKGNKEDALAGLTSIFLPSDWLHMLSANPQISTGFSQVCGTPQMLTHFWDQQRLTHAKFNKITERLDMSELKQCIPLLVHGDGAAFQDRDSLMTISFSGVLKTGHIADSNLLYASYPKSCATKSTWTTLWTWLAWDLNALYHNRWPLEDPFGNAIVEGHPRKHQAGKQILPDGYRCILYGVQGSAYTCHHV